MTSFAVPDVPVLQLPEAPGDVLTQVLTRPALQHALGETVLTAYLPQQRWFGAKGLTIEAVEIGDVLPLPHTAPLCIAAVQVVFAEGADATYLMPLTVAPASDREQDAPPATLARLVTPGGSWTLHEASSAPAFWEALFRWWRQNVPFTTAHGVYTPACSEAVQDGDVPTARPLADASSNSVALLGTTYFAKLYRRLEAGHNPEAELLGYLTEADVPFVPKLHGTVTLYHNDQPHAVAILQEALPVDQDGWTYARAMMRRFLHRVADQEAPTPSPAEAGREFLAMADLLGTRTATLHRVLAEADAPALHPRPAHPHDLRLLTESVRDDVDRIRTLVAEHADDRPAGFSIDAAAWAGALRALEAIPSLPAPTHTIRVHGDYHLGQIMRVGEAFYILDFEGEPARSLEERRAHDHALRDVAGMLRSIEYAALSVWNDDGARSAALDPPVAALVRRAEQTFLDAYYATADDATFLPPPASRNAFLWVYLLQKALYEVRYEFHNRPSWVWLPLRGLRRLLDRAAAIGPAAG